MDKPVLSDPAVFPTNEVLASHLGKAMSSFVLLFQFNHTNVRFTISISTDDLERIINKALEKNRQLRYQQVSDLRVDLKRFKRDSESRLIAGRRSATTDLEAPERQKAVRMMRSTARAPSHSPPDLQGKLAASGFCDHL